MIQELLETDTIQEFSYVLGLTMGHECSNHPHFVNSVLLETAHDLYAPQATLPSLKRALQRHFDHFNKYLTNENQAHPRPQQNDHQSQG